MKLPLALSVLLAFCCFAAFTALAPAATLTVNSSSDSDSKDGALTLREAILIGSGDIGRFISDAEADQIAGAALTFIAPDTWQIPPMSGSIGDNADDDIIFSSGIGAIGLLTQLPPVGWNDDVDGSRPGGLKVTLDGLENGITGLQVSSGRATSNRIVNLIIRNCGEGVVAVGAVNGVFEALEIHDCEGDGIRLEALAGDTNQNPRGNRIGECSIYANTGNGVVLQANPMIDQSGSLGNLIQSNRVGIDLDGAEAGNGENGIYLVSAFGNTIGGPQLANANIVGGNLLDGIRLEGLDANANVIINNLIGLTTNGRAVIGNGNAGITLIDGAGTNPLKSRTGNRIGGLVEVQDNWIGGNNVGVLISGSGTDGNELFGNFIGTNPFNDNLGNITAGVRIEDGAKDNRIDNSALDLAVIGFNGVGVEILDAGTSQNRVQSAYIGARTSVQWPNGIGVRIADGASGNFVGHITPDFPNRISGNLAQGIVLDNTQGNEILGNLIGVSDLSLSPAPNGAEGILLSGNSNDNQLIGNTIGYNEGAGISVLEGDRNFMRGNAFQQNLGLAIDLGGDGFSNNDLLDADGGANGFQNWPEIMDVNPVSGGISVDGILRSTPNSSFAVDFFYATNCGSGGTRLAVFSIGSIPSLTTNASGEATFSQVFAFGFQALPVVAIATDADGNTSEFTPCLLTGAEFWGEYE